MAKKKTKKVKKRMVKKAVASAASVVPAACPFCGSKKTVAEDATGWCDEAFVECQKSTCQATGPMKKTVKAAVKAWNQATA